LLAIASVLGTLGLPSRAEHPRGAFFRGINLNGPAVTIDGHDWEGGDTTSVACDAAAFEDQKVPLVPPTDDARARMIRSSRWSGQLDVVFKNVPAGSYEFFAYVWEDNNSETFDIALNGQEVVRQFQSGAAGTWKKLGPWHVAVADSSIRLTTRGGAANLSGVEIWKCGGSETNASVSEGEAVPAVPTEGMKVFDAEVAPILSRHCLECHGRSEKKGKLALHLKNLATAGGASGPVLVPGAPDESLVWEYVDSGEMPQGRPALSDTEKARLRRWITEGAEWGTPEIDPFLVTTERRAGYDWWSLQPVKNPAAPEVRASTWARTAVDRFILRALEARGLSPAPEADRATLIRRLSFDLTGLPPEPEEVERFVRDKRATAYERLVDRLLASPRYGERWARHWLDVVRFGESEGFERNHIRENAWRYRDWVIQAFNQGMAYDEFVRQQIAGDVLYPGELDPLVATGYHVCGTWDEVAHYEGSSEMKKATRFDELEDLVGTLGQTFLGLTIQCARCHDHKFDPISQKEYYQVAALLAGVNQEKEERAIELKPTPGQPDFGGRAHTIIPREPEPLAVFERGDYRKPGEIVAPSGLKALLGVSPDFGLSTDATESKRREALARWLTDLRNPLAARVFANRVWYHHFGQGIVETPSDFGYIGGKPSHPELLDFLASRLIAGGWRVKDLHRQLVYSAAYQQSSRAKNEEAEKSDAENRLLWRANRRRLEGEAVRDATLFVADALNSRIGGPSFRDIQVNLKGANTNHEFTDPTNEFSESMNRRTVYRLWARSGNNPLLESLDCPDPSVMSPRRTRTITPIQALSMTNNEFMERCADHFASRVRREVGENADRQLDRAWRLAVARPPGDRERSVARAFLERHGLAQLCLVILNTNEFLFVD
jgi:hypothetical protein